MSIRSLIHTLFAAVAVLAMASCSETNDEVEEYPDWKNKNEAVFAAKYQTALQAIAAGDRSWRVYKTYAKNADDTGVAADYIVVKVLNEGTGSGSPLFTDSVRCHYRGQLLASTSHVDSEDSELGLVFDKSWSTDTFSPDTFVPSKMSVAGVIEGFSTALQHMRIGDRWRVYIPYQLGYGETAQTKIPAYSTLVFDLSLAAYYRAGTAVPAWR